MSWYFSYFIGIKRDDGKIYPLGVYDANGKILPAVWKSRSFASDLWRKFRHVGDEEISDELKEEFGEYIEERFFTVLPYKELGSDDFVKDGYFLISEVNEYLLKKDGAWFEEIFTDCLTPTAYAGKRSAEFGNIEDLAKANANEEGPTYWRPYTEYMYFAYPAYESEEYETFLIKRACDMLEDYDTNRTEDMYIMLTQG